MEEKWEEGGRNVILDLLSSSSLFIWKHFSLSIIENEKDEKKLRFYVFKIEARILPHVMI